MTARGDDPALTNPISADLRMRAVETSLIVGVVLAVAAFGGTEPISFAVVEILFFSVAFWLLLRPGSASPPVRANYFVVPALLTTLVLLQLCPFPARFLSRFAGRGNYLGARFSTLSFAPYNSRNELLILLTCFVAFYLAYIVSQDRGRKQRLIFALVALGVAEAFYGLAQYLMNVQKIFWYTKKYDLEEATGTYINRNHFAGFLEMVLPFAVCLAIYEGEKLLARRKHRGGRATMLTSDVKTQAVILWLAVAVVLMAAIVFSRSRMGLLAACASLLVVFGLKMLRRKALPVDSRCRFCRAQPLPCRLDWRSSRLEPIRKPQTGIFGQRKPPVDVAGHPEIDRRASASWEPDSARSRSFTPRCRPRF